MDENVEHHSGGGTPKDERNPEESFREPGEMLTRRLAEATRAISRDDERFRAEERVLEDAFAEGELVALVPDELPDFVGSEHEVWSDGSIVLKATLPGTFGRKWGSRRFASPSEYFQRIEIIRDVFSFEWSIKGLTREAGRIRIVSEQPYIHGERPTLGQIDAFMSSLGFHFTKHRFGDFWYRKEDQMLVFDAEPGNFVKTNNDLLPVDLIVQYAPAESFR